VVVGIQDRQECFGAGLSEVYLAQAGNLGASLSGMIWWFGGEGFAAALAAP
jgi:hypothetical protein